MAINRNKCLLKSFVLPALHYISIWQIIKDKILLIFKSGHNVSGGQN